MLTYKTADDHQLTEINESELARKDALDVIRWGYKQYGDDLVYACSFGAEGIVLIDLISKIKADADIVFLDTDFHFKETYELIEKVKQKYPELNITMLKPDLTPEDQAEKEGDRLWESNPDRCCQLRKLNPLENTLNKYSAWMSGLRREQSPTRKNTQFVNKDQRFSSIKICPLIHWTWDDVWMYINTFELPYNPLHDQNYPSIGCMQCTNAVLEGEDLRSGRWAGQGKTECGLHK
ncbi:phosphoadenylylsulfate reductase (thioredoxin) [Alteribacillus persepolensis]|uniref:Adenosine 5'-phosphosulfate reductase n=1 Tax=Alteribacillus persepolensis TaxID=568899 RepID=A0A1G8C9A7_9BACI|nr:phosphoadenylyl-sulfate reductase [Alteribacillus persepolensis]SDH41899.1 phosphoadenylylsulfate reductase (thioredoxin) [Alteribacillus persepolensis]